jgi:hypothetical protein
MCVRSSRSDYKKHSRILLLDCIYLFLILGPPDLTEFGFKVQKISVLKEKFRNPFFLFANRKKWWKHSISYIV